MRRSASRPSGAGSLREGRRPRDALRGRAQMRAPCADAGATIATLAAPSTSGYKRRGHP